MCASHRRWSSHKEDPFCRFEQCQEKVGWAFGYEGGAGGGTAGEECCGGSGIAAPITNKHTSPYVHKEQRCSLSTWDDFAEKPPRRTQNTHKTPNTVSSIYPADADSLLGTDSAYYAGPGVVFCRGRHKHHINADATQKLRQQIVIRSGLQRRRRSVNRQYQRIYMVNSQTIKAHNESMKFRITMQSQTIKDVEVIWCAYEEAV